jgi:hypothetical protein
MGQYYKFIILSDHKNNNKECIVLVINPREFGGGSKLMEHSYVNTDLLNTVEFLISSDGSFHKSRCVWAGDYADEETNQDENLYTLAENYSEYKTCYLNQNYKYIINHTQKLYIDKSKITNNIHPLPLLISEGNNRGGGDYNGSNNNLCGSWARNVISMENNISDDYEELICDFKED